MKSRAKNYAIAFFLITVLLLAPASALTPTNAASPNSNEKAKENSHSEEAYGKIKKLVEQYPNTTPMQEKIKKGFEIMKNGDPNKPKNNNGKKDPKNIPGFKAELLGVEEIKKNGKLVGKTIKTKTTLTFKNKNQMGQTDEQWSKVGFDKNLIEGLMDDDSFKDICKQVKGKISKDGQYCDTKESFMEDINSKVAKLNKFSLDDDSFYLVEPEYLEAAKEFAKTMGAAPPKIKDNKGKEIKFVNNSIFKSDSNKGGIDLDSRYKEWEFVEEYTVDYTETLESIPEDADLSNFPIIPSSYYVEEAQSEDSDFLDFSEIFLPEAEAQTVTISEKYAMMGFTFAPPKFEWKKEFSDRTCFDFTYLVYLHIADWETVLGVPVYPNHVHWHSASTTICTEIFYFKIFFNFDIAAGFRLPVEVVFEGIPETVFAGQPFDLQVFLKPKDFTKEEFFRFCDEDTNLRNDPVLSLTDKLGFGDSCERFAFENFFYSIGANEDEESLEAVDDFNLRNTVTGEIIPIDGDEAVLKIKLGGGVVLKLFNRIVDVCAVLGQASGFKCVYGFNVDGGIQCTMRNIKKGSSELVADLFLQDYPEKFTDRLKVLDWNCASFPTPIGVNQFLFGIPFSIPSDCGTIKSLQWGKEIGPFKNAPPIECTGPLNPGPSCICTGLTHEFANYEFDFPIIGKKEFSLGIGIGAALGFFIGGGPVTANITVEGDTSNPLESDHTLTFGTEAVAGDQFTTGDFLSGCVTVENGVLTADYTNCFKTETEDLKFPGFEDDNTVGVLIDPSDVDGTTDNITVTMNDFEISFDSFKITADPVLELTGSIAQAFSAATGLSFGVAIPLYSSTQEGFGLKIGQHAYTENSVQFDIPVDHFGLAIPGDVTTDTLSVSTPVVIGEPVVTGNIEFSNDAPEPPLFAFGTHIITWSATNLDTDETRTFEQKINIIDESNPEIFVPDNVEVEAEGFHTNVSIGFSSATDIVDPDPTISLSYFDGLQEVSEEFTPTPPDGFSYEGDFPLGETSVEWVATDFSGNSGKDLQTVTVVDTTPPTIMAPGMISEFIEGFQTNVLLGIADVFDLVDPNPGISIDRDDATLDATCSDETDLIEKLGFTCADGTDPEATFEDGETIFTCADGTPITGLPEYLCDDGTKPEATMVSNFSVGTHDVVWTAVDENENSATAHQEVVVTVEGDDNQNFVLDAIEVEGFPCDADSVPCKFAVTNEFDITSTGEIIDRGGKDVVVSLLMDTLVISIATGSEEGTGPAKISVCDGQATINMESNSQVGMYCGSATVIGVSKSSVVEYKVGEDIAEVILPNQASVWYDDFFFNLTLLINEAFDHDPVTGIFKGEPFVLTKEFPVFNLDKIPPGFEANNIVLPATDPFGTIVNYEIIATDNLDPNPVVVCDPPDGTLFPMAPAVTVNCTTTDTSGNITPGSFTVRIFLGKETFDGLKQIIASMDLRQNIVKSFTALVNASLGSFDKDNNKTAINPLEALKKILNAQTDKQILEEKADILREAFGLIIEQLVLVESANLQSSTLDNSQQEILGFDENTSLVPSSDTNNDSEDTEPQLESAEQVPEELPEQTTEPSDNSEQPARGNQKDS